MNKIDIIKSAVNKFLGWKLPSNFAPDCGISFKPKNDFNQHQYEPVGTNLFTAEQAKAMFEYCLNFNAQELAMDKERHAKHHSTLHRHLDELMTDYMTFHPGAVPSKTTVLELMQWSYTQTVEPSELPNSTSNK